MTKIISAKFIFNLYHVRRQHSVFVLAKIYMFSPTGGTYGGMKVDEQFEKLLQKIFGADFINEYKGSSASQWLQLTNDFEKRKRISGGSMNMPLPYTFISKVQEQKNCQFKM